MFCPIVRNLKVESDSTEPKEGDTCEKTAHWQFSFLPSKCDIYTWGGNLP